MITLRPYIFTVIVFLLAAGKLSAQKVDSIFFHLYTDSLKKGTHNYINVDGKLSDGRWMPLTGKELIFSSTAGKFENNSLVLDPNFSEDKVTVKAVLRADTSINKSVTIYIKKVESTEKLKTADEVLRELEQKSRQRNRRNGRG